MNFHMIQAVLIMVVCPVICFFIEYVKTKQLSYENGIKWILFWTVGIRSVTAGLMQVVKPEYTAVYIFNMTGTEFYTIIRELGIANFTIGLTAVFSLRIKNWRQPAAFTACIFNLLLVINHCINFQAGINELFSLIFDILVVVCTLPYVLSGLVRRGDTHRT